MGSSPSLSVCMIVKNEADNLADIAEDCKLFADELIVVDTGSTDKTKEIARQFTDQVFDFEWIDDFSLARNFSLDKAQGDYILVLDADDRILSKDQARIKKLKEHMDGHNVFQFALHNVSHTNIGFYQIRCFPNRHDIRYEGRVHNQLILPLNNGLKVRPVNIIIQHVGYSHFEIVSAKEARTARLLKMELKEKPSSGRVNMYLGRHYEELGYLTKALGYYEMALIEFEPLKEVRAFGLYETWTGLTRVHSKLNQKDKAIGYLKKLSTFGTNAPEEYGLLITTLAEECGLYEEFTGKMENYDDIEKTQVLLVANNDWANVGYDFSQALLTVGIKAQMIVCNTHQFGYPKQGLRVSSVNKVRKWIEKADIIQFMHSNFIETGADLSSKRIFVFHGGTVYKNQYESINEFVNPKVEASLIQTLDMMGLGAKNEKWMLPAIGVDNYEPDYSRKHPTKLIIGHFHYNGIGKKTALLDAAIEKLQNDPEVADRFEYRKDDKVVSWSENIARVSACDVYAEQFTRVWGVAALEAAALGKIVVTSFRGVDRYEQEYGPCGLFLIQSDVDDIAAKLKHLILLPDNELEQLKQKSRKWVESFHNYKFIGNKLKGIYGL